MEYRIDDRQLDAAAFIAFANIVCPGKYDEGKTATALSKTLNITAYDGKTLKGRESAAGSFSRPGKILRPCCISARSRMRRNSMKGTGVPRVFNPAQ